MHRRQTLLGKATGVQGNTVKYEGSGALSFYLFDTLGVTSDHVSDLGAGSTQSFHLRALVLENIHKKKNTIYFLLSA